MRSVFLAAALMASLAGATRADPSGKAELCKVAEVNPVTGHVFCIRPLGAPVEPPTASESAPCRPDKRSEAAWAWGPKCKG